MRSQNLTTVTVEGMQEYINGAKQYNVFHFLFSASNTLRVTILMDHTAL